MKECLNEEERNSRTNYEPYHLNIQEININND